jgi:glycosyltransferase involved in cell wall biosynthesis
VQGTTSAVNLRRFRYILPDSLSIVGHARSLEADTRLKGLAVLLIPLWSLVAAAHLARTILRYRIDVLYAQWVLPSGFVSAVVARFSGKPLVIHLHGSDVFVSESNPVFGYIARWSFKQASAVIACSEDLLSRSIDVGLSPGKSQVIPYGADTRRYRPGSEDKELRVRLGVPERAPLILAMGRLVYKKGFEFLLRSAPIVLTALPETRFVIAGAGSVSHELVALTAELGIGDRVIFPGHIPWHESHRLYQMADVLVVPSVVDEHGNVDGLPNVLLEGMSTGLAIVASRVGGIPTIVRNKENGLLVPEKDPVALAEAISHLLQSPELRRTYGQAARRDVVTELDWSRIASRVAAVLEGVMRD